MNVQYFLNYKKLREREREREGGGNVTSLGTTMFITFSLLERIWCVNGTSYRERIRESGRWNWLNVVSDSRLLICSRASIILTALI